MKPKPAPAAVTRAFPVRAAVLLVAHGSARYPDAADGLIAHAEALRSDGRVDQVAVGLLNGDPSVAAALATLTAEVVHVVPFFMEDGYFSRVAGPRAVNAVAAGRTLRFCPPVGVHSGMGTLIEQRVLAWCEATGRHPKSVSTLLVGHGSARAPGRITATHTHAAWLSEQGHFAAVQAAFLEESPFVADVLAGCRIDAVVVVGLFANTGRHARDDLPGILAAENALRTGPAAEMILIGDDPGMQQIVLDQAKLRITPRRSRSNAGKSLRFG